MATTAPRRTADGAGDDARTLLVNAVVALVLGSGLMVLVHEVTHLVASLAQGYGATLFSFGVLHEGTPTDTEQGIIAGSAPVVSFLSGVVMSLWMPLRSRGGFGHLLWLTFAFSSMMQGIGYLVITPFGAGDTAVAVESFGWPGWIAVVLCGVGIVLQFTLAWWYAPHVGRIAGEDDARRMAFTTWAWLIATGVNLALTLLSVATSAEPIDGGEMIAVVAASAAVLVFSPMSMIFQRRIDRQPYTPLGLPRVPVAGIVALLLLIGLNQVLNLGVVQLG